MNTKLNLINLKKYAKDTMRYLRSNDEQAVECFRSFIKAGQTVPGVADMIINGARADSCAYLNRAVKYGEMTPIEAFDCFRNSEERLIKMNKMLKKESEVYDNNFLRLYPRTWKKRFAITSYLVEKTDEFMPVSNKKLQKRLRLVLYKLFGSEN